MEMLCLQGLSGRTSYDRGGIRLSEAPIAMVTKFGTRQSDFTHSSASDASQINSRVSTACPTGRSCLTNNTTRAASALC